MSEPAVFALIRDGETSYFADRWASAMLRREVLWGPEDFEAWVTQFDQLDQWEQECDGGAVVDFDKQTLLWSGDVSSFQIPRIWTVYCQLMSAAWPGYKLKFCEMGADSFATYLGVERLGVERDQADPEEVGDEQEYESRPLKVEEARRDDPEDDSAGEASDDDSDDDQEPRAWITLVEADGSVRQRQLVELSLDLLKGQPHAIEQLWKLPPAEIPKEVSVCEGLILNLANHTARIWGSSELLAKMKQLGKQWKGWQLKWTHQGYSEQCAASGTPGIPMSEVDALAKILPVVLSTEQFNLGTVMGVLGGGVKKFAKKATGCLVLVLCLPLALLGVFSGNWTAVLYAMGATIVAIVVLFMLVTRKFRNAVAGKLPRQNEDETSTVVSGPQEESARKARMDQLLALAKFPPLSEIEPSFPDVSGLEVLAM